MHTHLGTFGYVQSLTPAKVGTVLALWWLLCFVDAAWPQMQMAIFGNYVLFGMWPLHLLYLGAAGYALLRRGPPELPGALGSTWAAFAAYLAINLLFLEARFPGSFGDLLTTFYRFYFYALTIPLAFVLRGALDSARIQTLLLVLFIPLAALGLRQHFSGDPILPTVATNGTFQVYSWGFMGDVRAFSLFNSGWSFGHFAVLIGVLALWRWWFRHAAAGNWLTIALLIAAGICIYYSLTRTVYLVGTAAVGSALWLRHARDKAAFGSVHLIPALLAVVGYMVARGIKDVLDLLGVRNDGIFNSASLEIRQEAWSVWTDIWLDHGLSNALFGAAVTQRDSGQLMSESTVLIDNVFISIGAQIGLLGVLIWIAFMVALWAALLRTARRDDDPMLWAIVSVWATWPLSLMFGSGGNYYLLLALLAIAISGHGQRVPSDDTGGRQFLEQRNSDPAMASNPGMRIVRHEQVHDPRLQC